MVLWQALLFAVGLLVLTLGADLFIRGASGLGRRLGLKPYVIGLVIVGVGTSAPELAVNLSAAFASHYDLALGNVVGSNIANIGLILGLSALLAPIAIHMRLLRVEAPLMLAACVLLWLLALDGRLARIEGLLLVAGQIGVLLLVFRAGKHESAEVRQELSAVSEEAPGHWPSTLGLLVLGLCGLVGGGVLAVDAASAIARGFGISELIIGLTVVAIGTSLPELASSVVAALRGHSDIAIGNVIGSNLFNILFILGSTASLHPLPVAASLEKIELPVMIGFAACLLLMMGRRMRISRGEGALLLAAYLGLIAWQVINALANAGSAP